ncbi:tetratricopeptide repeat protein [Clostridium sp.]|uniref:tetratricopeptide repeat protein n=1 Tax=Clostridium sp. TaxID=1506 RepID=UPI003D6C8D23
MNDKLEHIDNEKFNSLIELGDLHRKKGDIESSLKYFKSAYDIAIILEEKKYQVDALIKITEGYFYKGEIEASIKHAEIIEELLKNLDYVKGKLDISLYLINVYYMKNEYYKAREIANEALKYCTEEHIIYKGRILNSLAKLYSELTSVDEHLDLLKQSLECFEKANYLKGILAISNNIGTVYADKVQDNEKALEYFLKLKDRSEDSNYYLEFNVFAYSNIGEIYFKCMRYEEALLFCELGLKKAQSAKFEYMVFNSYMILSSIELKLNNYIKAYDYYNLASKELKVYPNQGEMLPWYYKSEASLFLEFGEIKKAEISIKEALDMVDNEESIIKWNTGIVYEFVKLKGAKSKTDILGSLEGITYILSKYKNPQVILDIVCDATLELVDLGYSELAFELADEYKDMLPDNKDIILKQKYVEALRCNNEEKQQLLNTVLELAVEIQNNKLQLKICSSLGEYYFKEKSYEKSITYYVLACRQVKNIAMSVPKKFRRKFINSNNMFQCFNSFIQVKQYYSKKNENNIKYDCINNEDELIKFFEQLDKIIK